MLRYIEEETNEKIRNQIEKTDAKLIVANAVYFWGKWDKRFPRSKTTTQDYRNSDGKRWRVDLMDNEDYFEFYEDEAIQAVNIPYEKRY